LAIEANILPFYVHVYNFPNQILVIQKQALVSAGQLSSKILRENNAVVRFQIGWWIAAHERMIF